MAGHKGPLRIAIEDFFETGPLGKVIKGGIQSWIEDYEKELIANNHELFSLVMSNPQLPPQVRAILEKNLSGSRQASIIGLLAMVIGAVVSIAIGMLAPVSRSGEHVVDTVLRTARMPPPEFIQSYWRYGPSPDRGYGDLMDLGWSQESIQRWLSILEPQVAESDLFRLYHRYPNMRGFVQGELRKRGWSDDNIERLRLASIQYPGLQDLATMAVREVFNPAQRQSLGLDLEYPPEFGVRAEALGIDPDFAKDYWAAHWQLPSLTLAFQMLHRLRPGRYSNPVTIQVLDDLIKAHDISPVWRDRIRAVSYTPLTRVDIRRIYQTGGMSKADVLEAYKDLGYDEINAQRLADFATLESTDSGKNLTRSAIQNAYGKGLLDYDTALEELVELGYDATEAAFWLAYEDYEREEKLEKLQIDVIELRFMAGEIDIGTAETELHGMHLTGAYVATLLEEWRLRKAKRIKVPTKSELKDLYEEDIITYDIMAQYMRQRGYEPQVAEWLIALIDIKVQETRQKELERARKEQERLSTQEEKTEYQLAKSEYDTEIAEWRAYIADLKLTLHFVETAQQTDLIKQEIDAVKLEIANLSVAKANLKTDFLSDSQESEV